MSRYIDADKIILNGIENKTIEIRTQELVERNYTKVSLLFNDLQKVIDSQPTADVVEVVHGEWAKICWKAFRCSECKKISEYYTDFCPNCGADMRERRNQWMI